MSQVDIQNFSKCWGTTQAVCNVSFTADSGSFVVLLGPSGCGKTTILRSIAGLETPTSGQILIDGQDVTGMDPAKRGISMVFQSYALFPHLSVGDNITFGLKVRGVQKTERVQRLLKVAEIVDLAYLLDRKPSQLSGGQRQRVALARAIVAEHKICLMDEPLSNLDAKLRHDMRVELRALQQRLGMTVLYVTHDQTEAMSMADQVVLMEIGKLSQKGRPEDLYQFPANTFAAKFIGTPPLNLLPLIPHASGGMAFTADPARRRICASDLGEGGCFGVRPEHLQLSDTACVHSLPVKITSEDYHGSDTIVGVRFCTLVTEKYENSPASQLMKESMEQNEILVRVHGRARMEMGRGMYLTWRPEDLHVFGPDGMRQDLQPQVLSLTA